MRTSILISAAAICLASTFAVTSKSAAQETGANAGAAPATPAAAAPSAQPAAAAAPSGTGAPTGQETLEAEFTKALTDATMSGRFTAIKDGELTPEKNDTYNIVSVSKMSGDNWLINARIRYGKLDIVAPIPLQVKWAGDTAVICVTDLPIPGAGTYSARVLIYKGTYAGTWSGGGHGGLMSGLITPTKK